MNRFALALDLKNDPNLIAEYEKWHQNVWPEVLKSIRDSGVESMEIWRIENRLFMLMETTADFSLETKAATDAENERVRAWENLMWKFQQPLPSAPPGEKWMLMNSIFKIG